MPLSIEQGVRPRSATWIAKATFDVTVGAATITVDNPHELWIPPVDVIFYPTREAGHPADAFTTIKTVAKGAGPGMLRQFYGTGPGRDVIAEFALTR